MNIFKSNNKKKNSGKLKFAKNSFLNKKRLLPFVAVFGLLGGYLVYRSFAYTPLLNGSDGEFVALAPTRIMDTRNGNGGYSSAISANGTYSLQVADRGGIPAVEGVRAVVLSVAAVKPSANGYLTVWPSGVSRPTVSNINYVSGQTIANQVTVPVGADGKIQFFSSAQAHLIVDVSGYYSSENGIPGARYNSLAPARILDTRNGIGGYTAALPGNGVYDISVTDTGGVPVSNVSAVVVNVVAVNPASNGYATIWPKGAPKPDASSLNYIAGKNVAKLVTVPVGADGKVSIFSSGSSTNFIFDVAGYYSNDITPDSAKTQEGRFVSINPARIMDTRNGVGGYSTALPANGTYSLNVLGAGGVPTSNVSAVVVNIAAVNPSAKGYITAWPSAAAKPNASNINFVSGQSIANQAILLVGSDGKIQISSSAQSHVLVDVAGYFLEYEDQAFYTNVSASVIQYNGQIQFIDRASINKVDYDININELPTTYFNQVVYADSATSSDSNYANYRIHNLSIENNPKNGNTNIRVKCYDDCSSLSDITDSYYYPDATTKDYLFPYSLAAGKRYTITREIVTSQSGYSGRRLVTSITVDGIKKDLITEYFADGSLLDSNINTTVWINGYSCKSNKSWSYDIGNVKINNSAGYSLWTSGPDMIDYQRHVASCRGFVKTYAGAGTIADIAATRQNGSPVVSADDQSIFGYKIGISKDQRDTIPPVISNVQNVAVNCNGTPGLKTTYSVTDNGLVTLSGGHYLFSNGAGYQFKTFFEQSIQEEVVWCYLSSEITQESIDAYDDSGNMTSIPVELNIQ